MSENIIVGIRCRPFDRRELERDEEMAWSINDKENRRHRPKNIFKGFNHVFTPEHNTRIVYDTLAKDIVRSSLSGMNGTIFAYGQTASGKTYTMKGTLDDLGVIVLAIRDIFVRIRQSKDNNFLLRVAYMEIYNEQTRDLLSDNCEEELEIRENRKGFFVDGLTEKIVTSLPEVLQLMELGESRRHYGRTNMNDLSSRSHTIFRLIIESQKISNENIDNNASTTNNTNNININNVKVSSLKSNDNKSKVKVSCLNFVDLAGSERMNQTGTTGHAAKEARHINLSLFQLGTVINELIKNPNGHIPFRDSALTRILQSSLGGNSRTAIICTVSPALTNAHHTVSTLNFASRAVKVKTHAKVNEITAEMAMIKNHLLESAELSRRASSIPHSTTQNELSSNSEEVEEEIKRELELRLNHLRILVFKATSSLQQRPSNVSNKTSRPSITNGLPRSSKSLNHILKVANHPRRKSLNDVSLSMDVDISKLQLTFSSFIDDTCPPELSDTNSAFYKQEHLKRQLEIKSNKCEQLEEFIADMSKENAELLDQIQSHVVETESLNQRNQQLEQQVGELEKFFNLLSNGDDINNLSETELVQFYDAMQVTMPKVLKQIHFYQFQREGLINNNNNNNNHKVHMNSKTSFNNDELVIQIRRNSLLQEQLEHMEQIHVEQKQFENKIYADLKAQKEKVEELKTKSIDEQNQLMNMTNKINDYENMIEKLKQELKNKNQELDKLQTNELQNNIVALNEMENHNDNTVPQSPLTTKVTPINNSTNKMRSRIPRPFTSPVPNDLPELRATVPKKVKLSELQTGNDKNKTTGGFLKTVFASAKNPAQTSSTRML